MHRMVVVKEGDVDVNKYRFENFYLNMNNKQAFFAAREIAEHPGESGNPLYIYGGSHTGKTHLLYSIEQYVNSNRPEMKVIHATCSQFINECIEAIRLGSSRPQLIYDFREKYCKADMILIDDIDFLKGKQATQAEFLNAFNSLYESDKQIVMTGKFSPRELRKEDLDDSLVSRLEWGRVVEIPSDLLIPDAQDAG